MLWLNFVDQFPTALDFNPGTKKSFNSVLASSFRQNLAKFWSYKHNCPGNFERSSMNFPFSYWRRSYAPQRQGAHGPLFQWSWDAISNKKHVNLREVNISKTLWYKSIKRWPSNPIYLFLLCFSFEREMIHGPWQWRSVYSVRPPKGKVGCSNPSRDRPKSYKQVVTAPLPKGVSVLSSEMTNMNGCPVSEKVWHTKEPSLLNGHRCQA